MGYKNKLVIFSQWKGCLKFSFGIKKRFAFVYLNGDVQLFTKKDHRAISWDKNLRVFLSKMRRVGLTASGKHLINLVCHEPAVLEQRIAGYTGLGKKKIQVFNFIFAYSIEHAFFIC
jgi:hypothetical protein